MGVKEKRNWIFELKICGFEKITFFGATDFQFKCSKFILSFLSSPLTSVSNYGVAWIGLNFYDNTMISNQKLGALINLLHSLHKYLIPYLNCYGSTFLGVNVMRKCVMLIKCNDTTHANFWNFPRGFVRDRS